MEAYNSWHGQSQVKVIFRSTVKKNISFLSQISEERAQTLITNRPSVIGIAGIVGKRLHFIRYPLNNILDFLTACFHECHEYDTIATA